MRNPWVIVLTAALANSAFGIFWKRSLKQVEPPLFLIGMGLTALVFGVVYFLFFFKADQGKSLLITGNKIPWNLFGATIAASFFYILFCYALSSSEISKVYPLNAFGTIIIVALFGVLIMNDVIVTRKVIGILLGLVAVVAVLYPVPVRVLIGAPQQQYSQE